MLISPEISIMKNFFTWLFLISIFGLPAQVIDTNWLAANYTKEEVQIPMRDGVKLFTTIYAPKTKTEKHPILMVRTPYSLAPYGKNKFSPRLYTTHWAGYLKRNYIMVLQDVRGKYMSEGTFEDVRPFIEHKRKKTDTDEASDSYDTIDWLVKHVDGNNGNVGVFGISYPGFYSTMAALSDHPALKAVSPQAPVTDWFIGDDFHHNGAFALMDGFSFYYSFGKNRPGPTTVNEKPFAFPEKDNYHFYLKQGALKNYDNYMGQDIKFWKDVMAHPNYDEWWKARDARRACKNIKPAILVVGGTFDAEDCFGAWNLYKAIEAQSPSTRCNLIMGPWFHGGWHRGEGGHLGNVRFGDKTALVFQTLLEPAFFDEHLKGSTNPTPAAEAQVFFSGENTWRSLDNWPPKQITYQSIYFQNNHSLSFTKPDESSSFSKYTSDPSKPVPYAEDVHLQRTREYMTDDQRFASRRPDVLVFETPVLESDLTLAGPVIADLKVALSTTDADFVIKLIDVFPDDFAYDSTFCCKGAKHEPEMAGYQMLVRGEIMRGRFRNSFEKPEGFTPGKIETVKFELPDVAHTFKKGHKLMVQIQSSWFPLFDRNPQQFINIYTCDDKDFIPSDIRIFHQIDAATAIHLPILKN